MPSRKPAAALPGAGSHAASARWYALWKFGPLGKGRRMQIPQQSTMLRIFIGESDCYQHRPLYEAIVAKACDMRMGGATVLRGPMGFGHSSRVHANKTVGRSGDLPLVIEIVDSEEKIHAFLPVLHHMMGSGLITMQEVKVVQYGPRQAVAAQ